MIWPDGRDVTPAEADALGFLGLTPEMYMATLTLDGGTPQPVETVTDPGDELPKLPPGPIPPAPPKPRIEDLPQTVNLPPEPVPTVPSEQ